MSPRSLSPPARPLTPAVRERAVVTAQTEQRATDEAARAEYRAQRIREIVAAAPPLTDEQIKRLRRLLYGV